MIRRIGALTLTGLVAALVVFGVALMRGPGGAGQARCRGSWGFRTPPTERMTRHHRSAQFRALDHHGDLPVRARAAGLDHGALQRQGQSRADRHDAQHGAGSALDGHPGRDPGRDRDPVVPASLLPGRHPAGRHDHQGDRQAVVLDLRISRQRQLHLRRADAVRPRRGSRQASRGCSAPTTTSSCRSTRPCASSPPAPT